MAKKLSNEEIIAAYLKTLTHPLKDVINALRKSIASTDKEIGEEIKWNAPSFFYSGEMKPSDPKEYKKYILVFNLSKKDCIRLVFLSGGKLNDTSGLLEGDYEDGRRLAMFYSMDDVLKKEKDLKKIIKKWLKLVEK